MTRRSSPTRRFEACCRCRSRLAPPLETPAAGRPLVNLSFAINYAYRRTSTRPGTTRGTSPFLIASALLLVGIVRRTLIALGYRDAGNGVALAAALVWIVASAPQRNGRLLDAADRVDDGAVLPADAVCVDSRTRIGGAWLVRVGRCVVRGRHGDEGVDGVGAARRAALRPRLRLPVDGATRWRTRRFLRRRSRRRGWSWAS